MKDNLKILKLNKSYKKNPDNFKGFDVGNMPLVFTTPDMPLVTALRLKTVGVWLLGFV